MDANEFCRWLSGHFDMDEEKRGWTPSQAAKVAFNLDAALAKGSQAEAGSKADGFANWLQGYLEIHLESADGSVPSSVAARIEQRLDAALAKAEPAPPAKRPASPRFEAMC